MLTIKKTQNGDTLSILLSGSIEENVDFETQIGPTPASVVVNCKEVTRINSVGVKGWIKYFQALSTKGVKLKFDQCSTAIVEQINLISNFLAGGEVVSLFVPYACGQCGAELAALYRAEDLKKSTNVPPVKCSKCQGEAVFDDLPDEYFGFLKR